MALEETNGGIREGAESSDLGFGAVVSRESRERLLNADGTFNVRRDGLRFWETLSVYHAALTMSWLRFFAAMAAVYLTLNVMFAVLYVLCGAGALAGVDATDIGGRLLHSFFFSVQTLSTVGYGQMSPVSIGANIVVTFEAVTGLLVFALASGLAFARFSRPVAHVLFSHNAVIAPYHGITALEFRITNGRKNQLIELDATVMYTRFEPGPDGPVRRFYRLELERSHVTFFPLSWTIVHPINEASPLWRVTPEELRAGNGEILCLLTAIDETFSQTVHARSSYLADEVLWNMRFADIFQRSSDGQPLRIDVKKLGSVVPAVVTGAQDDVHIHDVRTSGAGV